MASVSVSSSLQGVLESLKDVIKAHQEAAATHEPTPTEYFAIVLSTLCSGQQQQHTLQLVEILHTVLPRCAPVIVRAQFRQLCVCLMGLCRTNTDNAKLLRLCLTSMGRAMALQEMSDAFWRSRDALQTLNALLKMVDDSKIKLRRAVQDEVIELLRVHKAAKSTFLRSYVADFCIGVMKACRRDDYKRTLQVVIFLERAAANFSGPDAVRTLQAAVALQECEQPVLSVEVFRMVDAFFQAPAYALTGAQTAECIAALFQNRPRSADMETNTYFCSAVGSAVTTLHKVDRSLAAGPLVQGVALLISRCEMEFVQVHCAVGASVKRMISACLDGQAVQQAMVALGQGQGQAAAQGQINVTAALASGGKKGSKKGISGGVLVQQVVAELEQMLQLRYQNSWIYLLDALRSGLFLAVTGSDKAPLLRPIIEKLGQVNEAVEAGDASSAGGVTQVGVALALTDTLGAALRAVGLSEFLSILPLTDPSSKNNGSASAGAGAESVLVMSPSRTWVFHVLKTHLRLLPNNKLHDFLTRVIEPCRRANQSRLQLANNLPAATLAQSKDYINRLWSLFPEVCYCAPSDIEAAFPALNAMLLGAMRDATFPDLLAHATLGLSNMIRSVVGRYPTPNMRSYIDTPGTMERLPPCPLKTLHAQCGVFLPALMGMLDGFDTNDHRFPNVVACIAAWTSIAPAAIITTMSKKLLKLLLSSTAISSTDAASCDAATCWMTVVLAIIPYLPRPIVKLLFRTIRPLLSVDESISLQKRAYRVLEALLRHHSEVLFAECGEEQEEEGGMAGGEQAASASVSVHLQILDLISTSLLTCNVSARHMRLSCMQQLFTSLSPGDMMAAADRVLGEILLCQKDSNKKTRDAALELLKAMVRVLPPMQLFVKLCSALAAETAVMRSSAVIAICLMLLAHKNNAQLVRSAVSLYPSLSLLLTEDCVEQTRAFLQLTKVLVTVMGDSQALADLYPTIALNLFQNIGGRLKHKFASRIRGILRKVVGKLRNSGSGGYGDMVDEADDEALKMVRSHVPAEDQALLNYILRQSRKQEKARKRQRGSKASKKSRANAHGTAYEALMGSDSEDEDEGGGMEGTEDDTSSRATTKSRGRGGRHRAGGDDDEDTGDSDSGSDDDDEDEDAVPAVADPRFPTRAKAVSARDAVTHGHLPSSLDDLIDGDSASAALVHSGGGGGSSSSSAPRGGKHSSGGSSGRMDMEGDVEEDDKDAYMLGFGADGKLLIQEKPDKAAIMTAEALRAAAEARAKGGAAGVDAEATAGESYNKHSSNSSGAGRGGGNKKRVREAGEEYRAKKGTGGDVWRQGQLEPHAYIPLDGRMLTKKNTGKALAAYSAVVSSGRSKVRSSTGGGTSGHGNGHAGGGGGSTGRNATAKRLQREKDARKQARRDRRREEDNKELLQKHSLSLGRFGVAGSAAASGSAGGAGSGGRSNRKW